MKRNHKSLTKSNQNLRDKNASAKIQDCNIKYYKHTYIHGNMGNNWFCSFAVNVHVQVLDMYVIYIYIIYTVNTHSTKNVSAPVFTN